MSTIILFRRDDPEYNACWPQSTSRPAGLCSPTPASCAARGTGAVRHLEGLVHGFLVLRTLEGDTLADGDLIQVAHGDRVTCRLVFHFKDGSIHDETAVFSQRRNFRLLSNHLVQKGPAFQHPIEVLIDGSTGQVTVHDTNDNGKQKVATDHFDLIRPKPCRNQSPPGGGMRDGRMRGVTVPPQRAPRRRCRGPHAERKETST